MTSAEQWEEVWSVFEDAIALPPEQRLPYVAEVCGDRAEVQQAVIGMLAADGEVGTILDQPPVVEEQPILPPGREAGTRTLGPMPGNVAPRVLADDPNDPDDEASFFPRRTDQPATIGPYRILKQVGEGGMSTVYLAVRSDDAYRRRVVVKVVRRDMVRDGVIRRLRTERQILAGLDHPFIARLYDGAATESGEPYFVMEYVDGLPIDAFCQHNRLSVEKRIALFVKVCAAVQFAHRNLIVHRDIKPSNILVTAAGDPKLLDFGIAKVLNPEAWPIDLEPTRAADRMLTPSYASPEQYRGGTVTTTSDVYSLGVLFYRLLTGGLPHDLTGRSPGEIERVLCETEPLRPSLAAEQPEGPHGTGKVLREPPAGIDRAVLSRALSGDLDAIVLKALRGAPENRYPTIDQLVADLDRYQQGQPVEALRGTWRYRAGKFVRRHRTGVVVSALVLTMLTSSALALAFMARRAVAERNVAREERNQKAEVLAIFEELVAHAEPFRAAGKDLSARELVLGSERALANRVVDHPALRAQLLHTTGSMLLRLGALDESRGQLEKALDLRRQLHAEAHPDVAATLRALARVRKEQGDFDEAETLAREALAMIRQLPEANPADVASCLTALASVLCVRQAFDLAEDPIREALALAEEAGAFGVSLGITNLEFLALVETRRGHYEKAVPILREAVRKHRAYYGDDHPFQLMALNDLGLSLRWLEEWDEAEEVYEDSRSLALRAYGKESRDYAMITNNLGGVRYAQGSYGEAIEAYEDAREALIGMAGPDHWRVFFIETNIEAARVRLGEATLAERNLRAGRAKWQQRLGGEHWLLAQVDSILGEALAALGRRQEAETLLVAGFERLVDLGATDRTQRRALERLTGFLTAEGRSDDVPRFEAMLSAKQEQG